jgi:hypothetical protein
LLDAKLIKWRGRDDVYFKDCQWPIEELIKLQQKKEQQVREMELLKLIGEDLCQDQEKVKNYC